MPLWLLVFGLDGAWAQELISAVPKGDWTSILPPLLAVVIALLFRQVLLALFLSIWLGAYLAGDGSLSSVFGSFFLAMSDYISPAIANTDHAAIMIFSLMIGGMIGIIQANGGTRGIIDLMSQFVKNRRHGQIMTVLLGLFVFFDDYSNTLIVGNTMRPLTDKLRISRAKLAYLVDSTAAPVATVALVSTWIGAMVAYIADAEANMPSYTEAAYLVFINSLPYNFYAFLTIFFVILIAWSGKDFGAMFTTRVDLLKAKTDPKLDKYNIYKKVVDEDQKEELKTHWTNAAVPIIVLIVTTIAGLFLTGQGQDIQTIIGSSDSYSSLLWASLLALFTAGTMTISQRLLNVEEMIKGMNKGMHMMFDGLLILVLAWALSDVTKTLHTADFLISIFNDTLNPFWIPVIIFVLSALTSFATGSSWGTMGIIMPLVVPLVWNLAKTNGLPPEIAHQLIYGAVSAVLAGSVWGDHCSPISDTTILSSLASQCDHVEHVKTQLPYALFVGLLTVFCTIAAFVWNIPVWILYAFSVVVIVAVIWKFGQNVDEDPDFEHLVPDADTPQ